MVHRKTCPVPVDTLVRVGRDLQRRHAILTPSLLATGLRTLGIHLSIERIRDLCLAAVAERKFELAARYRTYRVVDATLEAVNKAHELATELAARIGGKAVNGTVVLDLEEAKKLAIRLGVWPSCVNKDSQ